MQRALEYLPGVLLPRLAALAVVLLGTRLLPTAEYGYYALAITLGEFLDTASAGWLRVAYLKLTARKECFTRADLVAPAPITVVAAIISIIAALLLVPIASDGGIRLGLAAAAYACGSAVLKYGLWAAQAAGNVSSYRSVEIWRALCVLVLVPSTMHLTADFVAAIYVFSALMILAGAFCIGILRRGLPSTFVADGAAVRLEPALIAVMLLGFFSSGVERLLLERTAGATSVAIYSAAYAISRQGFDVVGMAVNLTGFSRMMAAAKANPALLRKAADQQLSALLRVFVPAVLFLVIARHEIAAVLLPQSYAGPASQIMVVIAIGAVAFNLKNYVTDNILHAFDRGSTQIIPLVVGALVTCGSFWVFRSFDQVAAAVAFASGAVAALLTGFAVSYRLCVVRPSFAQLTLVVLTSALIAAAAILIQSVLKGESAVVRLLGMAMTSCTIFFLANRRCR
jgi:hypothetical protein